MAKRILQYETVQGKCPFREWFLSLKDVTVKARIRVRIDRLRIGHFGDAKPVGGGVFELRFHFGPGCRIYYGLGGDEIILLLSGGDKNRQIADINRAQQYLNDYLRSPDETSKRLL